MNWKALAFISFLTGIYCCMGKDPQHLSSVTLGSKLIAQDSQDKRRFQIRSLDQTSSGQIEGIEGASSGCGYFALYNGNLCASALMFPERSSDLADISSTKHAQSLFGNLKSPWRLTIMQERFKPTARKIFQQQVLEFLHCPAEANKEDFEYLTCVIKSLDARVIHHPEIWEDSFRYHARKDTVYSALWDRMATISREGSSATKVRKLLNRDELDIFFKNVSVDFSISFDGVCSDSQFPHTIDVEQHGRWVRTTEMPALIDSLHEQNFILTTYGEALTNDQEHAVTSEQFIKLYSTMRKSKDNCVGVVLVYISPGHSKMRSLQSSTLGSLFSWFGSWFSGVKKDSSFKSDFETCQGSSDYGHWISLVVSRINGIVHYYVFDSLANANRLRDPIINEIIDIFDGKKPLPGYEWTSNQMQGLRPKEESSNNQTLNQSWVPFIVGTGIVCALTYTAYSYYKKNRSDKKSE